LNAPYYQFSCHFFIEKSNQKLWLEELVPPFGFTQTAPSQIRYFFVLRFAVSVLERLLKEEVPKAKT
jgi:hypothetical protein